MITALQDFRVLGDHRGKLIALEANRQIPFDVKRIFYIYGTQERVPRGNHSHYKTKQFLICVNGSCKVTLDNGNIKETYNLNKPNIGLFQDKFIWGTMYDFSNDCVLIVLASEYYDESDYIRNYSKFLEEIENEK